MSSNAQGAAPSFLVIAGEISGDHHAAALVEAVSERMPGSTFFGIGGELMREQGVETLYDVPQMAVMGIWEVLIRYPFFRRVFNDMLKQAEQRRPTAVILKHNNPWLPPGVVVWRM